MNTTDNALIGKKIKALRQERGMSQVEFSKVLGISYQQVQKYEVGANAIGVASLKKLSDYFEVPFSYFLQDMTSEQTQLEDNTIVISIMRHLVKMDINKQKFVLDLVNNLKKL